MLKDLALPNLSLAMAQIASAAYLDDCSGVFQSLGFNNYQHINNDDANGHLAYNDTEAVISFRGTNPSHVCDLATDANVLLVRDDHGLVHDGFRTYAIHLFPQVLEFVKNNHSKDIYVVGHSLGAAMALYTTRKIEDAGYTVKTVFTFGQPRLGTKRFVDEVIAPHYRFVNCVDVVPTVPPEELGYVHQGTLCYIDFDGNIKPSTTWQIFKDKWRARLAAWKKFQFFTGIEDHFMENYIAKLVKIQQSGQSITL